MGAMYWQLNDIWQAPTWASLGEAQYSHLNVMYGFEKGNTMGAMYWQLNDIWQAPTWASTGTQIIHQMVYEFVLTNFQHLL